VNGVDATGMRLVWPGTAYLPGYVVERFVKPPQYGGVPGLRYRIVLA